MLIISLLLGCDLSTSDDTGGDDTGDIAESDGGQEGEEFGGTTDTAETTTTTTALTASSTTLVLGTEIIGCVHEDILTVSNNGSADSSIAAVELSVKSEEFSIKSDVSLPTTLTPGSAISFQIGYAPLDESVDPVEVYIFEDPTASPVLTVVGEGQGILHASDSATFSADGVGTAFSLSTEAVDGTLTVLLDGTPMVEGSWSFSAEIATVILNTPPVAGGVINIGYAVRPASP